MEEGFSSFGQKYLRMLIAALILLPLFFQMSTGIFNNPEINFDTGGVFSKLPIPISVLACYGGILSLGGYRRALFSFKYIFITCFLMTLSAMILTQGRPEYHPEKFILLIQFILPMFALALGQVYAQLGENAEDYHFTKAFLFILLIIIPVQLFFTWQRGVGVLSPKLGLFAIYQFLQYVPVILVSAYLISLFSLWHVPKYKILLLCLVPFMAIYISASLSMLAVALFFSMLLFFALFHLITRAEKLPIGVFFLALILSYSYFQYDRNLFAFKFPIASKASGGASIESKNADRTELEKLNKTLPNVAERIVYWKYYAGRITSSPESLLLGAGDPPSRAKYPSAHNYYLDFIYNFGILALLPTLLLIGFTVIQIYKNRREIFKSPSLVGLCLIVLFLVIADNSMKVGLRQPYPGIFTFFLWGMLLTKLAKITNHHSK